MSVPRPPTATMMTISIESTMLKNCGPAEPLAATYSAPASPAKNPASVKMNVL